MAIQISKPDIGEEEKQAVLAVLDSGMLAQGKEVSSFEREFADYNGTPHAVATSSGTAALFVAMKALGVGEGDLVITTPFSFVATASTILHCGAKPVFCDIDRETCNLDLQEVEKTLRRRNIQAILLVHLYGTPCPMDDFVYLSKHYGVPLLEDCAQAHGAEYRGKKVGSFGAAAAFSFYGTKNMTTGEGGMITTWEPELANTCRMLINHGSSERYRHVMLGYNFRMTDIAAALGRVQLGKLPRANQKRVENAAYFQKALQETRSVQTPVIPKNSTAVFHQYTLKIEKNRDGLASHLGEEGIGTGIYYPVPLHKQKFMEHEWNGTSFPCSEEYADKVLSIPVHPQLSEEDRSYITSKITHFFREENI